jgi:hypothetical protein
MAKHKYIETPEKMYEYFQNYVKWAKSNPIKVHVFVGRDGTSDYQLKERPLTYEGFCNYLVKNDIISTPDDYFLNREGRYSDYVTICSHIKREIRQEQIEGGMSGIYNPSITQRLNNLVEKTDVTTGGDKLPSQNVIDLSKLDTETLKKLTEGNE